MSALQRPLHPMPADVEQALSERGLAGDCYVNMAWRPGKGDSA